MIKGDFAKLAALQANLSKLGPAAMQNVAKSLAAEALALTQEGFAAGKAPDGAAWAPLKHRQGQPLRDTGRMGNSFTTSVAGNRVQVGTNTHYAPYHQTGTSRLPARPMLPAPGELPPAWAGPLDEAAREAMDAELEKLTR